MEEKINYGEVKLKSGLEIHQQLDTGKLFSRTPSLLRKDKPDYEIKRKLHRIAGEEGDVDEAVEHEASLDREFVYQGYNDSISLVELDEEPPREIDEDALDEVIKIALLLNCEIYPYSQIMRKTVIDGSNTGGFQRTVLIGHEGFIETSFGKVGIESIALEEDSARTIENSKSRKVYRLDRLGIPLVEITTKADMKKPEEIKEAALKIGEILRACKVKRGIGTIRQDVNVSTKDHERVEIKGFQDPKMMVKTVDLEIKRQQENKKEKGHVRKALETGETEFMRPMPGKARMYPETDLELLKIGRDKVNYLKKHLPKLREEIKELLEKKGLKGEVLNKVMSDNKVDEFSTLLKVYSKDAELVGKMVSIWRNDFAKKMKKTLKEIEEILSEKNYEHVLDAVKKEIIGKEDIRDVLEDLLLGKKVEEALKREKVDLHETEETIRKIVKEKPGLRPNAYMGIVMKELGGKVNARDVMQIINKIVEG